MNTKSLWGENNKHYDTRFELHFKLPGTPALEINQVSAITAAIGTPFVLDCGTLTSDQRRYLLVINSKLEHSKNHDYSDYKILRRLDKIDGIYAIQKGKHAEAGSPPPSQTQTYSCVKNFLELLRNQLSNQGTATQRPQPISKNNHIFDLTPQFKQLGFFFRKNEWIHIDTDLNHLIIHAPENTHESILSVYSSLLPSIRMVRVSAHIVSVDIDGMETPTWSLNEMESRHLETIRTFSLTGRSGEKATGGKLISDGTKTDQDSNTKPTPDIYEFEIETTIGEGNTTIDCRLCLESDLNKDLKLRMNTALTLTDGKPNIIELGNPVGGKRTHLLVIQTDVIRPDGSFYRDTLKPIPVKTP